MTITLGGLTVYPYGLALACAALVCLFWMRRIFRAQHLSLETYSLFAALSVPFGVFFARIFYVVATLPSFRQKGLVAILDLPSGGFMLYGAMFGIVLAAVFSAFFHKESPLDILDAAAAPAALLIAFSRMAEGLIGQGYGMYIVDWFDPETALSSISVQNYGWLQRFPFAIQDMYEEWAWAVFMLEALAAIIICVGILFSRRRRSGDRALLMVIWYAALQLTLESLRQDAVLRLGFVRISQLLSAVLLAFLLAWMQAVSVKNIRRALTAWVSYLAMLGVIILMEFAVEKKIAFLQWMHADLCYLCIACASVATGFILMNGRKAFQQTPVRENEK